MSQQIDSVAFAKTITKAFEPLADALKQFGESILGAAQGIDRLHRSMILYVRAGYVEAGKPYGNGYAPMMKWWRQTSGLWERK